MLVFLPVSLGIPQKNAKESKVNEAQPERQIEPSNRLSTSQMQRARVRAIVIAIARSRVRVKAKAKAKGKAKSQN